MIILRDIRKDFEVGGQIVRAVKGVDLSVEEGAFLSIMGSSGSGKSTLLNLLGCLDVPTSGEYLLDGRDVANLDGNALSDVRGSKIGFIFQSYNLLPQITVLENVMLPLIYQRGIDRNQQTRAKELVGLTNRMSHKPFELSGGQQQRVAIARALINDPKLLLADEPTGNLDSKTEEDILDLFSQLNESGKTIVVVTHEQVVADRSKEVIEMKDGVIINRSVNVLSQ